MGSITKRERRGREVGRQKRRSKSELAVRFPSSGGQQPEKKKRKDTQEVRPALSIFLFIFSLFLFVSDQLVHKTTHDVVRRPNKPAPIPRPSALLTKKKQQAEALNIISTLFLFWFKKKKKIVNPRRDSFLFVQVWVVVVVFYIILHGTRWLLCPCRSRFGVTENVPSYVLHGPAAKSQFLFLSGRVGDNLGIIIIQKARMRKKNIRNGFWHWLIQHGLGRTRPRTDRFRLAITR